MPYIHKERAFGRLPDLYLLCSPDIPWEFDPQRENPHDRLNFFNIYKRKIEELNVDYVIIKGTMSERLKMIEQSLKVQILSNYFIFLFQSIGVL